MCVGGTVNTEGNARGEDEPAPDGSRAELETLPWLLLDGTLISTLHLTPTGYLFTPRMRVRSTHSWAMPAHLQEFYSEFFFLIWPCQGACRILVS